MTATRSLRNVLCLLVLGAMATPVFAQPDPATLAANCISALETKSTRCAEHLATLGGNVATRVNELQADGTAEGAMRAARAGARAVNTGAERCVAELQRMARRCVQALERLEASDELVESVRGAGRTAIQTVNEARRGALEAIRTAVED
ncbi:MAG: hypothetical protein ACKVS9_16475 [Phycisphaerae bacterium]